MSSITIDREILDASETTREVIALKDKYATTWRDKPESYWFARLMQEAGELGSSLVGDHKDPPEWELKQIATICLNWLEMRTAATAPPAEKPWPSWLPPVSKAPGWARWMTAQTRPNDGQTDFHWQETEPEYDGARGQWHCHTSGRMEHHVTINAIIKMPTSEAIWRIPGR